MLKLIQYEINRFLDKKFIRARTFCINLMMLTLPRLLLSQYLSRPDRSVAKIYRRFRLCHGIKFNNGSCFHVIAFDYPLLALLSSVTLLHPIPLSFPSSLVACLLIISRYNILSPLFFINSSFVKPSRSRFVAIFLAAFRVICYRSWLSLSITSRYSSGKMHGGRGLLTVAFQIDVRRGSNKDGHRKNTSDLHRNFPSIFSPAMIRDGLIQISCTISLTH